VEPEPQHDAASAAPAPNVLYEIGGFYKYRKLSQFIICQIHYTVRTAISIAKKILIVTFVRFKTVDLLNNMEK
jgi:hypothetical protein